MPVKYRKDPCAAPACGWKFEGFHICLGLSEEIMKRVEDGRSHLSKKVRLDEETTTTTSLTARHDPRKIRRNRQIVASYKEGLTVREIHTELDVDRETIMRVLQRAADEGDIVIQKVTRTAGRS